MRPVVRIEIVVDPDTAELVELAMKANQIRVTGWRTNAFGQHCYTLSSADLALARGRAS